MGVANLHSKKKQSYIKVINVFLLAKRMLKI